jgi:hypothetical protein
MLSATAAQGRMEYVNNLTNLWQAPNVLRGAVLPY